MESIYGSPTYHCFADMWPPKVEGATPLLSSGESFTTAETDSGHLMGSDSASSLESLVALGDIKFFQGCTPPSGYQSMIGTLREVESDSDLFNQEPIGFQDIYKAKSAISFFRDEDFASQRFSTPVKPKMHQPKFHLSLSECSDLSEVSDLQNSVVTKEQNQDSSSDLFFLESNSDFAIQEAKISILQKDVERMKETIKYLSDMVEALTDFIRGSLEDAIEILSEDE